MNECWIRPFLVTVSRCRPCLVSRSIAAALLTVALGVSVAACTGVPGRPEGAPIVATTDAAGPSADARSAEAARASAAEQSRVAASSIAASASSVASASAAAEASRIAAEQAAAADQARQQAEQEAAASAAAEAERAAAEQAAAEQAAAEEAEAQRQAAADQAQFDAALASGTCTDAPAGRVTECVGLIEDSVPPGDAGADGASPDDGSGGWYDAHGNWVSPETAARALAEGIPVGGDVPGYLRCGTLCGESATSGEIQSEWAEQQGLLDEDGAPAPGG